MVRLVRKRNREDTQRCYQGEIASSAVPSMLLVHGKRYKRYRECRLHGCIRHPLVLVLTALSVRCRWLPKHISPSLGRDTPALKFVVRIQTSPSSAHFGVLCGQSTIWGQKAVLEMPTPTYRGWLSLWQQ